MRFTVDTKDLRAGLIAIAPHICHDPELPTICRVRMTVEEHVVTFSATDRFTMGLALVSVIAHEPDPFLGRQFGAVDLPPEDVGKIMNLFKVGRDKHAQYLVEFDCTDTERVTVSDVSGMVAGDTLEMPRMPLDDMMPNLRQSFANWLSRDSAVLEDMSVGGQLLARFKTAATAYEEPLILRRPERAPILIECGESFLGALAGMRFDETAQQVAKNYRVAWERRLPTPEGGVNLDESYVSTTNADNGTDGGDGDE